MPEFSGDERAEFERLKLIRDVTEISERVAEQKICGAMGVQWRADGGHWRDLEARQEVNRDMRDEWTERRKLVGVAKKSAVEKITGAVLMLVAGTAGGGFVFWIAGRLHLPVPGQQQ